MDEETKKVEVVKINDKTRNLLIEINKNVSMLQNQVQVAIQSYLDALGKEGDYSLNAEMTMLISKE